MRKCAAALLIGLVPSPLIRLQVLGRKKHYLNENNIPMEVTEMDERKMYEEYVADARKSGDRKRLASHLSSLGNICARQGAVSDALKYLQEAYKIRREIGDNSGLAQTCFNLAGVYDMALHDDANAIKYLREGLALEPTNDYYRSILDSKTRER